MTRACIVVVLVGWIGWAHADPVLSKGSAVGVLDISSAGLTWQQRFEMGAVRPGVPLGQVGDLFAIGCIKAVVAQGLRPVEMAMVVALMRGQLSLDRLGELAHADAFIEGGGFGRVGRGGQKELRSVMLSLRDAKTGKELNQVKIETVWTDALMLGERACEQLLRP